MAAPTAEGCTPFIKEEVKQLNKIRRHAQNKGDLTVDLSPKRPQESQDREIDTMCNIFSDVLRLYNAEGSTPFIKEEVKQLIKIRRHAQNKGDLTVDLSPKRPQTPSAEELAMQVDRRNRNNAAARKYRRKQRNVQSTIQREYNKLVKERQDLETEIEELKQDKQELQRILKLHERVCHFRTDTMTDFPRSMVKPNDDEHINQDPSSKQPCDQFWTSVTSDLTWSPHQVGGALPYLPRRRNASLSSSEMSSPSPSPLTTPSDVFHFSYIPEYLTL